tara:strand:+ start:1446 stop:1949 length:504 start_codon:yes stop_codon:yes gene_type:complete
MDQLKTFEEFIQKTTVSNENAMTVGMATNDEASEGYVVSEELQRKMWEYAHESMTSALEYQSDDNDKHTIAEYLKESCKIVASKQVKSLRENVALIAMAAKKLSENEDKIQEEQLDKKDLIQSSVKEELNKAMEAMSESYCRQIEEMMSENVAIAAMVASDMLKEKE